MKAKLFTLVVMLFMVASLQSQVIFTENFNYPAGDPINTHGWNFVNSGANILVKTPGLTYTGYPLSGIGNCARLSSVGIDAYENTTGDSVTSGSVYASFMIKVDSAKGTGDYFFSMTQPTSTTNFFARVFAKDTLGGLYFGASKYSVNATILPTWGTTGFSYLTTYLVVIKYKFIAGTTTDDEVSLFVFTSPNLPATEPGTPYVGPITTTQTDANSLGRVNLRQGTAIIGSSLDIDGITIGKTWANIVTGVTPISTIATDFSLSQNYPNPFNPSTTINFSIPKSGFVTLKVYDVNGKEVKSLVNNNMTAGKYEVNANFASLNSGVYFYTINVSGDANFSQTKKLMLVK